MSARPGQSRTGNPRLTGPTSARATLGWVGGAYAGWRGHVIVCGLHGVGLRIVELLNASGIPAVVIDDYPDLRLARDLIGWGIPHIAGSSRSAETLAGAGLARAGAVICAQEDDLRTLETALLTRELRSDVRVVVQLSNPAVGRALARIAVSVLDVAGLSAPSIAEACLRTGVQEIRLASERSAAARTVAPCSATLRELYGALAPIAVLPADGGDVVLCPGRDHRVAAGDGVTLIGTPDELRVAGVTGPDQQPRAMDTRSSRPSPSSPGSRPSRPVQTGASLRHLVGSLLNAVDRRLVIALAALFAVVIGSTVILRLAYRLGGQHIPLLDAAYFTVETVTTVGYGDFSFRNQSPWLMGAAILLMLVGALFVAVFFAMLTNMLVSRRIEESLGRPADHRAARPCPGHRPGLGRHAGRLPAGRRGQRRGRGREARRQPAPQPGPGSRRASGHRGRHPAGDAAVGQPGQRLGRAVLTSDDLANLETGLAVRDQLGARWDRTPVVLRMVDPQLARSVRHNFGFRNVRPTAALAAPWFVEAASARTC